MAAKRCSICSLNYPITGDRVTCDICGETLNAYSNIDVTPGWLRIVKEAVGEIDPVPAEVDERPMREALFLKLAREAGYRMQVGDAAELAASERVDPTTFQQLLHKGATPGQAARILL